MSTVRATKVESEYRELLNKYLPRPIQSQAAYERMKRQLLALMSTGDGQARSQMIELLSTLIENFESREHPTPHVPVPKLLAHLIIERGGTATQLARETGIPQATISNVLAGRRGISKANALKLGTYFRLPPGVFL